MSSSSTTLCAVCSAHFKGRVVINRPDKMARFFFVRLILLVLWCTFDMGRRESSTPAYAYKMKGEIALCRASYLVLNGVFKYSHENDSDIACSTSVLFTEPRALACLSFWVSIFFAFHVLAFGC